MKTLFTILLFFCCGLVAQAQYVIIPDSNLVKVLKVQFPKCMNGNQMDTTCPGIVNATQFDCQSKKIQNLTGVQYFDKLTYLIANYNQINSWPQLPPKVTYLQMIDNKLAFIPALPAKIQTFYCDDNLLTSLPVLPSSLAWLSCGGNKFTSLPALPSSLAFLNCPLNQLTSLPTLPASLRELFCHSNKLVSLPTLPVGLEVLACGNNPNMVLPALPSSITELDVNSNNYSTLPALPASLWKLVVGFNVFTSLPVLPASLKELYCNSNQLTTLPALPAGLQQIYCMHNKMTVLPALPAALRYLDCSNNKLTAMPTMPDSIFMLNLSNNPAFNCMPPLKKFLGPASYFNISGTAISCLPNVIQHSGSIPAIDTLPLCGPCAAPVFHFGKITATTAVVLWNNQDCITNFRLAYRVKGTTTWTALVSGPVAASRALNGLTAGTQYEIRMRTGCTSSTLSAWSAIQTFKTDVVCVAPSGITVTTIKKDRATLNWNAIAGVYSYKIRYRVQGTSVWSNQTAIAPVVHKTITGLAANTTYEYQMLTVCDTTGAQASGWTGTATFKTTLRMEDGSDATAFVIYPNPVTTQCTVRGALSAGDELVVTDIFGRELITERITQSADRTTINVGGLSRGVYFVTLRSGEGSVTRKFVKQ